MADRCPTCGQIKKRSLEQNKRLHALFSEIAANVKAKDGLLHPAAWWKAMSVDRWLGYDEFVKSDGTIVYVLKRTSELDVKELNDFMNEVERFANNMGIYLQE